MCEVSSLEERSTRITRIVIGSHGFLFSRLDEKRQLPTPSFPRKRESRATRKRPLQGLDPRFRGDDKKKRRRDHFGFPSSSSFFDVSSIGAPSFFKAFGSPDTWRKHSILSAQTPPTKTLTAT